MIGHHFFSPANIMKLLEIVRGRETSPSVIATSVKLGKRLAKVPVVVGNCFGFVANRMLAYYMREAYLLLEEGASVPQIDRVLTDFGLPVGPLRHAGHRRHRRRRAHSSVPRPRSARRARRGRSRKCRIGCLRWAATARKPARAGTRYEAGSRERIPDPLIDQLAAEAAAKRGIARRQIDDEEILARVTTALANEGRAGAGGRLRDARRRHRRHLLSTGLDSRAIAADRCSMRIPWPQDRVEPRARIPRAIRRLLGAGAAAGEDWWRKERACTETCN